MLCVDTVDSIAFGIEKVMGEFLWVACVCGVVGGRKKGERARSMQERAGNTSPPRWWKQTEQYLCELMRTENNLFEQNEKCKKHIEASSCVLLSRLPTQRAP